MRVMFQLKEQPGGGWVVKSWPVKFCCWSSGFKRPLLVTQCINDLWEQSLLPGCGWHCSKLTGWSLWIEKKIFLTIPIKLLLRRKIYRKIITFSIRAYDCICCRRQAGWSTHVILLTTEVLIFNLLLFSPMPHGTWVFPYKNSEINSSIATSSSLARRDTWLPNKRMTMMRKTIKGGFLTFIFKIPWDTF